MGSKLTRQRSLDFESKLTKRRRQRNDLPGESERSAGRTGGDFMFTSLMIRSDKLPGMLRRANQSPYVRRVAWVREIQRLLREQKMEQAGEVLKLLRKVKKKKKKACLMKSAFQLCMQFSFKEKVAVSLYLNEIITTIFLILTKIIFSYSCTHSLKIVW